MSVHPLEQVPSEHRALLKCERHMGSTVQIGLWLKGGRKEITSPYRWREREGDS